MAGGTFAKEDVIAARSIAGDGSVMELRMLLMVRGGMAREAVGSERGKESDAARDGQAADAGTMDEADEVAGVFMGRRRLE